MTRYSAHAEDFTVDGNQDQGAFSSVVSNHSAVVRPAPIASPGFGSSDPRFRQIAASALAAARIVGPGSSKVKMGSFDDVDRNHDGVISRAEFAEALRAKLTQSSQIPQEAWVSEQTFAPVKFISAQPAPLQVTALQPFPVHNQQHGQALSVVPMIYQAPPQHVQHVPEQLVQTMERFAHQQFVQQYPYHQVQMHTQQVEQQLPHMMLAHQNLQQPPQLQQPQQVQMMQQQQMRQQMQMQQMQMQQMQMQLEQLRKLLQQRTPDDFQNLGRCSALSYGHGYGGPDEGPLPCAPTLQEAKHLQPHRVRSAAQHEFGQGLATNPQPTPGTTTPVHLDDARVVAGSGFSALGQNVAPSRFPALQAAPLPQAGIEENEVPSGYGAAPFYYGSMNLDGKQVERQRDPFLSASRRQGIGEPDLRKPDPFLDFQNDLKAGSGELDAAQLPDYGFPAPVSRKRTRSPERFEEEIERRSIEWDQGNPSSSSYDHRPYRDSQIFDDRHDIILPAMSAFPLFSSSGGASQVSASLLPIPGQSQSRPRNSSTPQQSWIRGDWVIEDDGLPADTDLEPYHHEESFRHESIPGSPIPKLAAVSDDMQLGGCSLM